MHFSVPPITGIPEHLQQVFSGRYSLEGAVGEGGMSSVFLARDRKHADRRVALKVLRPEVASALGPERFLSEIRIAAVLSHPHIVPMFDSGEQDGLLYYVMPFVEGVTLRERLRATNPLAVDEIIRIAEDVASALSYAHGRGVIHRDIKPENIMLAGDEAMVTDFGIARAVHAGGHDTGPGLVLGTPGYMSPEQASGIMDVDPRADLYSLGCVVYEMVVGTRPRTLLDREAARTGTVAGVSPAARERLDAVPRALEAVIARSLAVFPEERYESAAALGAALRAIEPVVRHNGHPAIAVLPFAASSGNGADALLGEGLAEEIINALTRVRTLRVAPRNAAFIFKDNRGDARRVGRELGVNAVLEGSVRLRDDQLRVAVQLIDVADGYLRWSATFERPMREVLAIQDEIARHIITTMRLTLSDAEIVAVGRAPTIDPTAYEYYLRGRQFFHQARKKSLEYARELFTRAIEADPDFALAHAGIADCSSLLHMYYPSSAPELEQADRASRRALELAPDLAEAHAARGFALFQLKRHDDAAAEFQTAIRLDPAQFEARYFCARQCFQRGQLTEAARWFEEAARVRESPEARFFAAQAYEAEGLHDDAMAAYRTALGVSERHLLLHPDDPRTATMRAVALCRLGRPDEGLEWARRALAIDPEDAGVRYNVACLYALENRAEDALDCLEDCVRLGFGNVEWIARDPDMASLRNQPRFEALVGAATSVAG
jgi:TolB-like protein/Flp pilus assembly protein TadD